MVSNWLIFRKKEKRARVKKAKMTMTKKEKKRRLPRRKVVTHSVQQKAAGANVHSWEKHWHVKENDLWNSVKSKIIGLFLLRVPDPIMHLCQANKYWPMQIECFIERSPFYRCGRMDFFAKILIDKQDIAEADQYRIWNSGPSSKKHCQRTI